MDLNRPGMSVLEATRTLTRQSPATRVLILSVSAGAGHVRICYAQSYELLEQAMERMRQFVGRTRVSVK